MGYISVKDACEKWGITERVVRQYCEDGRIPGAFITGKSWNIPDDAAEKVKGFGAAAHIVRGHVQRLACFCGFDLCYPLTAYT